MRYPYQGTFIDGLGRAITGATVSVYLAGTNTAANVYAASSGGSHINYVLTDSSGYFIFYVDEADYAHTQYFKVTLSKANYRPQTVDSLIILPPNDDTKITISEIGGGIGTYLKQLFDASYSLFIKPSKIFGGSNNTNGHTVPNVADDTFAMIAATQVFTNKTLTSPTINNGTVSGTITGTLTFSGAIAFSGTGVNSPNITDYTNATHDHHNVATGGTIPSTSITGPFLGTRDNTPTLNAAHLAATDLFIAAWGSVTGGTGAGEMILYSDSSNPPTTVIDDASDADAASDRKINVHGAIKKGQYYKVTTSGTLTGTTISAIPLGS